MNKEIGIIMTADPQELNDEITLVANVQTKGLLLKDIPCGDNYFASGDIVRVSDNQTAVEPATDLTDEEKVQLLTIWKNLDFKRAGLQQRISGLAKQCANSRSSRFASQLIASTDELELTMRVLSVSQEGLVNLHVRFR